MIIAPYVVVTVGGLPAVVCKRVLRAEGIVNRFDIPSDGITGINHRMLREWFEQNGQGGAAGVSCAELCEAAARATGSGTGDDR